ncbi:serine/threonine-protein kinase M1 [Geranomyces michiganensis]|nr:serine/threonine-protein kinase M1 [Geranomyces michiganensis]
MAQHNSTGAPAAQLLNQLYDYVTRDAPPSQQTDENILAFRQLFTKCVRDYLVERFQKPVQVPPHEIDEYERNGLRNAELTVVMLHRALQEYPEVFEANARASAQPNDSQALRTSDHHGPVYFSQRYGLDTIDVEPFDIWVLASLLPLLGLPELRTLHALLLKVIHGVLMNVAADPGSDSRARFDTLLTDIMQLPAIIHDAIDDPFQEEVHVGASIYRLNDVYRTIDDRTNHSELLKNVYYLLTAVAADSCFYAPMTFIWNMIAANLQARLVADCAVFTACVGFIGQVRMGKGPPPVALEQAITAGVLRPLLDILRSCRSSGSMEVTLADFLDFLLDDNISSRTLLCIRSLAVDLIEPECFNWIKTTRLRQILIRLYARAALQSNALPSATALHLLRYLQADENLAPLVLQCFSASRSSPIVPIANAAKSLHIHDREDTEGSASKRRKLNSIEASGTYETVSTSTGQPSMNEGDNDVVTVLHNQVRRVLNSARGLDIFSPELVANAKQILEIFSALQAAGHNARKPHVQLDIDRWIMRIFTTLIDSFTGCGLVEPENEQLLHQACYLGPLTSEQGLLRIIWVLSLPWITNTSERDGTDAMAQERTAAANALCDLVDFSFASRPVTVANLRKHHFSDACIMTCLRALISISREVNSTAAAWIANVVISSMSSPAPEICAFATHALPQLACLVSGSFCNSPAFLTETVFDVKFVATRCRDLHTFAEKIGFFACAQAGTLAHKTGLPLHEERQPSCQICDSPVPDIQSETGSENIVESQWSSLISLAENHDSAVQARFCLSLARLFTHIPLHALNFESCATLRFCLGAFSSLSPDVRDAATTATLIALRRVQDSGETELINRCVKCLRTALASLLEVKGIAELVCASSALGKIGQAANEKLLFEVLKLLLHKLGDSNSFAVALASEQIQIIARSRGLTIQGLYNPYMAVISKYLVCYWRQEPKILSVFLKLVNSADPEPPPDRLERDFYELNLQYILPHAFASRDTSTINAISQVLGRSVKNLLFEQGAPILAAIIMQDGVKPVHDYMDIDSMRLITISMLVGHRHSLIPRLTLELGKAKTRSKAEKALMELIDIFSTEKEAGAPKSLSDLLHLHILATLEVVNERLKNQSVMMEKQSLISSVGEAILRLGPRVASVLPQALTTLQTGLDMKPLRAAALQAWRQFLEVLAVADLCPILNQVCVTLTRNHQEFKASEVATVVSILDELFARHPELLEYCEEICELPNRPEFQSLNTKLLSRRPASDVLQRMSRLLTPLSEQNSAVSRRALQELVSLLNKSQLELQHHALADNVDPCIVYAIRMLMETCRRYNGSDVEIQHLCCECLGALGAIDPSRVDVVFHSNTDVQGTLGSEGDFETLESAILFATAMIENRLAPACRSAHDTTMQRNHVFAIQELLRFCGFTPEIAEEAKASLRQTKTNATIADYLRVQWARFSPAVRKTIRPFINAKYTQLPISLKGRDYPIFSPHDSFNEWVQFLTVDLIIKSHGERAQQVFKICTNLVIKGDINVAQYLLPHLILNALVGGTKNQTGEIRAEFMAVLSGASERDGPANETRVLCCQTIFSLVDHLTKWLRMRRRDAARLRVSVARRQNRSIEETDVEDDPSAKQIEQFLSLIPQSVMADASSFCKAYARALMHFENHIRLQRAISDDERALLPLYAHLQRLYSHLDEPDGMEGIATMLATPTLEQQILEHESAGRWTDAQTCYELSLQTDPDNFDHHVGLINCLKNLGHLETLLTHVRGTASLHPQWSSNLNSYAIEAAWRLGSWDTLESLLEKPYGARFETSIGALLHAGRVNDTDRYQTELRQARYSLIADVAAASMESYRRGYDCMVKLHMLHEIASVVDSAIPLDEEGLDTRFAIWKSRLDATKPSYRIREPILSLRRIISQEVGSVVSASLSSSLTESLNLQRGLFWLQTTKAFRKAGHLQAAYNGILQASRLHAPDVHRERAKLHWEQRQPHRAMFELRSKLEIFDRGVGGNMQGGESLGQNTGVFDATRAKTQLLLSRWTEETSTLDSALITAQYKAVTEVQPNWEKGNYYLGRYLDKTNIEHMACKYYAEALRCGSRYIYQTLPRLLTIWLELGQTPGTMGAADTARTSDARVAKFFSVFKIMRRLNEKIQAYKVLTAISQIASRIGHQNANVHQILENMLVNLVMVFPQQAIWQLMAVGRSTAKTRAARIAAVFAKARNNPMMNESSNVPDLIQQGQRLTEYLIDLCNYPIAQRDNTLSVSRHFRALNRFVPLDLIVPLQSALSARMPTNVDDAKLHNPFPDDIPKILGISNKLQFLKFRHSYGVLLVVCFKLTTGFQDEVEVMSSLQRPRKLTIRGSDGRNYIFLCKPKDDLRKDCRLMEFNAMINKLLKKDPEARTRRLYVRTYAVVPLNEECGLIEWVPNTIGFRHIMIAAYKTKNIFCSPNEARQIMDRKQPSQLELFVKVLKPRFPAIFHEWFLETFPEPTQWLSSRLAYASTMAVMSMIGYVVGLGDRHGENILFDDQTGDAVHVDLNCLFEKGLSFEKPERVPFRLTHNMVDAFGVTGVEGVFRKSCEATMKVLHDHRESLVSVLETFLYDPLCEWNKPPRKTLAPVAASSAAAAAAAKANGSGEMGNQQARETLDKISKKLEGHVVPVSGVLSPASLPLSSEGQVRELISQATSEANLAVMYIGKWDCLAFVGRPR